MEEKQRQLRMFVGELEMLKQRKESLDERLKNCEDCKPIKPSPCKRFFQNMSECMNKFVGHPYAASIVCLLAFAWVVYGFIWADAPIGYGQIVDSITIMLVFLMQRSINVAQDATRVKLDALLLKAGEPDEVGREHIQTDEQLEQHQRELMRKASQQSIDMRRD